MDTDGDVAAWFACHEAIDHAVECKRVLTAAGSPYEDVQGHGVNRPVDEIFADRVDVVNRYDWDYYDQRAA